MQATDQLTSRRTILVRRTATAIAAASALSFSCAGLLAQEVNRPAPVAAAPVASGQASAVVAPAPAAPAPAAAPSLAAAEPAATGSTLPAVNVSGEKPKQKPVQRQVQGPKREPIRIPVNASGCRQARVPGKP